MRPKISWNIEPEMNEIKSSQIEIRRKQQLGSNLTKHVD